MKQKKPTMLRVYWHDATHYSGWMSAEEAAKATPMLVETTGYKLHEDKQNLMLTMGFDQEGRILGVFIIPKPWIAKTVKVR